MADQTGREGRFRRQALLGLVLVVAAAVIPAGLAVYAAYRAAERRDHVGAEYAFDAALAERLRRDGVAMSAAARGFALAEDPAFPASLSLASEDFDRTLEQLRRRTRDPKGALLLDRIEGEARDYKRSVDRMVASRRAGASADELAQIFEGQSVPRWRALSDALAAYVELKHALAAAAIEDANQIFGRAFMLAASGLVVSLGLSAWLGLRTARRLAVTYRRERQATERAEEAVTARQELLEMVAHDLRSPLAAIAVRAGMIARAPDPERTVHHARSIQTISLRMGDLIRTLLDAASIEAGQLAVEPQPCEVTGLLAEILELFQGQADAKQVELVGGVVGHGLAVRADRGRVIQALANLVDNAVKHTPAGGEVRVLARGGGEEGKEVWWSVSDTGPGVDPEHAPHLFERFWQAESGGVAGTGLGLFITRGIVEAHGGRVWLDPRPGPGATFWVALPALPPAPAPEAPEPLAEAPAP